MKKLMHVVLILAIAAAVCGCFPKRVTWSPDGKQALVIGGKWGEPEAGLYLCDEQGQLSAKLAEGVTHAAWFADGRQVAVVRALAVEKWQDLEGLLASDARQRLTMLAEELARSAKTTEQWAAEVGKLEDSGRLLPHEEEAIQLYLRDVKASLAAPELLEQWSKASPEVKAFVVQTGQFGADRAIGWSPVRMASLSPIWDIRVSPSGQNLACVSGDVNDDRGDKKAPLTLWVLPADGSRPARLIEPSVAMYPDWTADGRSVVYLRQGIGKSAGPAEGLLLGTVRRRTVCDEKGQLLSEPGSPEDLAGLVMNGMGRVRCLRDGRILFSSAELQLPATQGDVPENGQLFLLDPQRTAAITRLIPRKSQAKAGENLNFFEVSPDEKQVVFPDSRGGALLLDLPTGNITALAEGDGASRDMVMLPVWRYPNEMCFAKAVKDGPEGRKAQVMLRSADGKERAISDGWADEVAKGFLK